MPIYEYRCPECGKKVELILPIGDRNYPQVCPRCQAPMSRLVELPLAPIVPVTGRDHVLANLNSRDDGIGNYPRNKAALWKGLNQRSQTVGRGFG